MNGRATETATLAKPTTPLVERQDRGAHSPRPPLAHEPEGRSSPVAHELQAASERRAALSSGRPLDDTTLSAVERVLETPGDPLHPARRTRFERHLRAGLGEVRVHSGADAARSARLLGARAYTVGSHIVLGGAESPATSAPDDVLAHELTHVLQQSGAPPAARLELVEAHDRSEAEAKGDGAPTRLARQAVQRLEEDDRKRGTVTPARGTGGMLVLSLQLRGQLTPLFLAAFLDGLTERLIAEELESGRASKALERLGDVQLDPRFHLGYGWGFVQGLASPITDLFAIMKLGHDLQQGLVNWALAEGAALLTGPERDAVAVQALDLAQTLVQLDEELRRAQMWVLANPLDAAHMLGSIADEALPGALMKARETGGSAAEAMYGFVEKPAWDLGEALGYIAGAVVVEVLLLVFTQAIGNAIRAGLRALATLGRLGRTATRAIIAALRAVREAFALARAALAGAGRWAVKQFAKLFALFDELLEKAFKLADTIANGVRSQAARAGEAVKEGLEALGPRFVPADGPPSVSVLTKGGDEAASEVAEKGRKEAVKALYPEKVHPANRPLEARAVKEGGGGGGATKKPAETPVVPTVPRSTLDHIATLEARYPGLREANLRPVPRDLSLPGLFDESARTGSGKFSFQATFEGHPLQLDDIAADGRIIDVKMRDTGRTFGREPGMDPEEHVPDVVELMDIAAGRKKPRGAGGDWYKQRLPEDSEAQLARQVRFAEQHGLPGVVWQTNVDWMAKAIRRTAAERGWTGFVTVELLP